MEGGRVDLTVAYRVAKDTGNYPEAEERGCCRLVEVFCAPYSETSDSLEGFLAEEFV